VTQTAENQTIIVPEERTQKTIARLQDAPPQNDTQAMIAMIERVAANPQVDPQKMQQIVDLQMQILDRNASQAFAAAMAACNRDMPAIARKAENRQTNSTYAKHEAICQAIKPVYSKHGFSLMFYEGKAEDPKEVRIMCDIVHELGHKEVRYIDLPPDIAGMQGNRNKTDIHGKGSTFSYGRRYLTLLIFDLATYDDDDGNRAGGKQAPKTITEEQVKSIEALITELGVDKAAFLKAGHLEKLEDLPASKYTNTIKLLEKRRKEVKSK